MTIIKSNKALKSTVGPGSIAATIITKPKQGFSLLKELQDARDLIEIYKIALAEEGQKFQDALDLIEIHKAAQIDEINARLLVQNQFDSTANMALGFINAGEYEEARNLLVQFATEL